MTLSTIIILYYAIAGPVLFLMLFGMRQMVTQPLTREQRKRCYIKNTTGFSDEKIDEIESRMSARSQRLQSEFGDTI